MDLADEATVKAVVLLAATSLDPAAMAAEVTARIVAELPELNGSRSQDPLTSSVRANIDSVLEALTEGISPDSVELPSAAKEYTRWLAQRGLRVTALVRAYRLGQGVKLPAILTGLRATSASTEVKLLAHDWITLWSLTQVDAVTEQVIDTYELERDRWVQGRSGARTVRIRELLADDDDVDQDATGVEIGYRLRGVHMALTAWYPEESVSISTNLPAVLIRDFASVVDGPLLVAADHHAAWGWLPITDYAMVPRIREAAARLAARADGPRFTFGTVQSGLSGFRRSHREAIALRRVAGDHSVVDAADPGMMLTALVGTDRQAAHDWAETVLGPLASDTEPDARMRATLRVFLRTGGSYKATAEELLLHPNSVKYRVGRAIERRGRPIGDDRLDVEAALLVLDATSAGSPD